MDKWANRPQQVNRSTCTRARVNGVSSCRHPLAEGVRPVVGAMNRERADSGKARRISRTAKARPCRSQGDVPIVCCRKELWHQRNQVSRAEKVLRGKDRTRNARYVRRWTRREDIMGQETNRCLAECGVDGGRRGFWVEDLTKAM